MGHSYKLIIKFNEETSESLYEGESYLRTNLSDELTITNNKIELRFSRSKKISSDEVFASTNSLIRYELQRALCFYDVVRGYIPEVDAIVFAADGVCKNIENHPFTELWRDCIVEITLPAQNASIIFSSKEIAKAYYITMTYFVKAQIDKFSNDRYRAAWTGLNGLYRLSAPSSHENVQLDNLWKKLDAINTDYSEAFIDTLDEKFWSHLEWYNFVKVDDRTKFFNGKLNYNWIQDSDLLRRLLEAYGNVKEKDPETNKYVTVFDTRQKEKQLKRKIEEKHKDNKSVLRFLIRYYCYMIRNRYFHGIKAYPLFVVSEEAENYIETTLTRLLLYTIKDCFLSGAF